MSSRSSAAVSRVCRRGLTDADPTKTGTALRAAECDIDKAVGMGKALDRMFKTKPRSSPAEVVDTGEQLKGTY